MYIKKSRNKINSEAKKLKKKLKIFLKILPENQILKMNLKLKQKLEVENLFLDHVVA